jgi:hypothetical protein
MRSGSREVGRNMAKLFDEFFEKAGIPLLCLCLPGILLTLNGLRAIKNRRTISVGTDSQFRWKTPVILKGKEAVKDGKWELGFGLALLLMGIISLIGVFS